MTCIRCPYCKKMNTKLFDGGRNYKTGYRRKRICLDCGKKFATIEEVIFLKRGPRVKP